MNRNFKFRVWSTKENKWMFGYEYPNLGGFSLVGETILLGEFGKYKLDRYFNDFAIMQYTGMEDSIGKEIYEGDILEGISNNIFDNGSVTNYEVIWDVDHWHICGTNFTLKELFKYCNNKIKIVGNIYEIPKLHNNESA